MKIIDIQEKIVPISSEIKNAYRKMAAKYHPDKVLHLGDEFAKVAEEKFKSINDAYQKIKKERNI